MNSKQDKEITLYEPSIGSAGKWQSQA